MQEVLDAIKLDIAEGNNALQYLFVASYVFLADALHRDDHASLESTVVVLSSTTVAFLANSVAAQNMLTCAPQHSTSPGKDACWVVETERRS